ncbi:D-aminoacyl-tRNA deacylase [Neisseriaceae bacterium ESL0693]|nr:D-aminoacyl-tRNA deacylase [Neisseriaceae bacterium ESL0693]
MRALIQKVTQASVDVIDSSDQTQRIAAITHGLMVLLGVTHTDSAHDVTYIADKITHLRIFTDEQEKMNLCVKEVGGHILLVSQFTLYGDTRRGRRPSFSAAAAPSQAQKLYEAVAQALRQHGLQVQTGQFGAHMQVQLTNDGPTTFLLDSIAAKTA